MSSITSVSYIYTYVQIKTSKYLKGAVPRSPLHLVLEVLLALGEIMVDHHDLSSRWVGPGAGYVLSEHIHRIIRLGIAEGVGILRRSQHVAQVY